MSNKILNFYKETSTYTDLGLYKEFAKELPNDIEKLCLLQRQQMIHPTNLRNPNIRCKKNSFFGDMTEIPITRLNCEDDIYPTAISMFAELLRKESKYHLERKICNKIHITCRGQAILLASILKAKGIPARVRSGFSKKKDGIYHDHWITEYYNENKKRWIFVDADMCCDDIDFNPYDVPQDKFLLAANAWISNRNGIIKPKDIYNAGYDFEKREKYYIEILLRELFYDFHCLMNNEIIYLHIPKYLMEKHFILDENDKKEIDNLAKLMLNPNENFDELLNIWKNETKFRIMGGALN